MPRWYRFLSKAAIVSLALITSVFVLPAPQISAQTSVNTTICVVVPHFKDEYWLSVGFGLQEEAKESDVELLFFESGGYLALHSQIALLGTCLSKGAQAILLGAVSADAPELLAAVKKASKVVPVLALVNELQSDHLAGSIGVDWRMMGRAVGRYLAAQHPTGSPPVKVGFVTGPRDSGWSPLLESGLRIALVHSAVNIVITRHADTGFREQLKEVEAILAAYPNFDYLIGSAPAIEGAMGLAAQSDAPFPKMIATYISHSIRRGLHNGQVIAVPFDDPVLQGQLALHAALIAMRGENLSMVEMPTIRLIESEKPELLDITLSPADLVLAIE